MSFTRLQSVCKPRATGHEVNGVSLNFYSASPGVLCSSLAELKAILLVGSRLWADHRAGLSLSKESFQRTPDGTVQTVTEPIEPHVRDLALRQREDDLSKMIDSLTAPAVRLALGRIIADSLRDESEIHDKDDETIQRWIDGPHRPDLETLLSFLHGVYKANTRTLAPFLQRIKEQAATEILERAAAAETPDLTLVAGDGPTKS